MTFGTNNFNSLAQETPGFDQWNNTLLDMDHDVRSRDSSTNLISPTSGSMDAIFGISAPTKDFDPSNYVYNASSSSGSGSGSTSTSGSASGLSFQSVFNNGNNTYPVDTSFDFMNGFQDLTSNEYIKSAAAIHAAKAMFGIYGFNNNTAPTSVPPQAVFQTNLQDIPIDQAPVYNTANRSPSPLFEVDEASSPELTEVLQHRRRASESLPRSTSQSHSASKRRGYSISTPQDGRIHLEPEEKARRAAAADGLSKGDKRRMQNKLAQRAFRARSKVVNRNAAGRLEHLEELTEQQSGRIGNLTELVGRLQKENYALKSSKFQEAMMKGGIPQ